MRKLCLSIDVGGSHVALALVEEGRIIHKSRFTMDFQKSFRICLEHIEQAGKSLLLESNIRSTDLGGLGLSLPMLVDSTAKRVVSTPANKYSDAIDINLAEWAEKAFGVPFYVEVDAHAACLGEWLYGAGQGSQDMVYVIIGTGYGCSVIVGGKPLRGRNGLVGIRGGHITVNAGPHHWKCICPGYGCVEAEIGSWALERKVKQDSRYNESNLSHYEALNYKVLFTEAQAQDTLAQKILDENLSYLGISLVNLIHAFDPEKIILAGGIMKASDIIMPTISRHISQYVWSDGHLPELCPAEFIDDAALLGMYALVYRQIEVL